MPPDRTDPERDGPELCADGGRRCPNCGDSEREHAPVRFDDGTMYFGRCFAKRTGPDGRLSFCLHNCGGIFLRKTRPDRAAR